jgi:hypothetical protein
MEQIMADQTRMDMLPVHGGPVQKSTFEAPMASFATLMQRQASAQRSERDELRRLREELKEKNRLRGGCEQRINLGKYAPEFVRHLTLSTSKNNEGIRK